MLQVGLVVGVIVLWQSLANRGHLVTGLWSNPGAIWDVLKGWFSSGSIWPQIGSTLQIMGIGYVIGVALGTAIGIAYGMSEAFRRYAEPFIVFMNAIPRILLFPVFVIWLGYGATPKIVVVALAVVFMVILNVSSGVREIGEEFVQNVRALGGTSWWQIARTVYVPGVGLWTIGAARVSLGYAFQTAVIAEFFGGQKGLGFLILQGQSLLQSDEVFAGVAVTLVLALIIDLILLALQRRATRWMPEAGRA